MGPSSAAPNSDGIPTSQYPTLEVAVRRFAPRLPLALVALLAAAPAAAITVPAQFVVENAVPGVTFTNPTGVVFVPGGRMLVIEKRGRVYVVNTNGTRVTTPMWSRENEVLDQGDRGLLGITVDPNYVSNKFVYLLYTVDPDSNSNDNNDDAFSRLVRYRVSAADSNTLDPASRTVLIGTDWRSGVPIGSSSHTIGELQFGRDGSLLISTGDGAQFNAMDDGGVDPNLFGATRTDPFEDIGAFRAQYIGSLAGKILRIDPATGLGYPSNPYYEPGSPGSARSRVWCYGLRNPFRFTLRPGTGSTDPAAGSPGALFIGDVGYTTWEEENVTTTGGRNFGWPCYEGFGQNTAYQAGTPSHHGCSSMGTAENPGALTAPMIATHHGTASLSTPPGITGNAASGSAFYTGTSYPTQYRGQYFYADYGQNWIKVAQVNSNHQLQQVLGFATSADAPVCLRAHPGNGDIHYVSITTGEVRRIRWTGPTDNNLPPIANATGTPATGAAPLAVAFSSTGSSDPDGDALSFDWSFGDGGVSNAAAPSHTYTGAGSYPAVLTVSDGRGGIARDTVTITATGAPAGFPSTAVLDNFNRANGAVGGSWVGDVNGMTIASNALTQTCCAVSAVWNGAVFGPDQEAYITLGQLTPAAPEHDLMLKVQGTSYTAGHIEVRYTAPLGQVQVSTYLSGVWTNRGTPISVNFVAGDRFGARAYASGAIEVYRNGTLIGTRDAADWPYKALGGRLGLTLDLAFSSRFDDFGGGNVVAGNSPPTATIQAPANGAFFVAGQTINLSGTASDVQDPPAALVSRWEVDVHHNNHIHPASYVIPGTSGSFLAENHDDGTGVFYGIRFLVTDTGGLQGTSQVSIYPEIDLAPSAVTTAPAAPASTDSITWSFRVRNLGRMPAPLSRWRLRDGATMLAEADVLVPPLDSVAVAIKLGPLSAGNHVVRVTCDTLAAVNETNEGNNAATRTVTVTGPPPPPPPPGGFPTTAVLDDFNRANGPVGGAWVGDVNGFVVNTNQGAQSCCYVSAVWDGAVFGPDQEAYIRLNAITASAPEHDLMLKVQGTSYAAGHIEVRYDATAGRVQVSTHTPATGWVNRGTPITVTFVAGDRFGARARPDGTIEVYRNATMIGSRSAGNWPHSALGGRIGFTMDGALTSRLDDFGGGNVVAAAAAARAPAPQTAEAAVGGTPREFALSNPWPSPSDGAVELSLQLPAAARVSFVVHDLQGRVVWRDPRDQYGAGSWRLRWDGRREGAGRVPAGVYLARVTVDGQSFVRRLVMVR